MYNHTEGNCSLPHRAKHPIVGFVRYSCRASFSSNNFFTADYLDYRLNIFKSITLKSFQEQTDKDFNVFLLQSENLPEKYKKIFKNLEDENPFLFNIYIPDSEADGVDYINAVSSSVDYVEFFDNVSINFRIDNDDALPADFIAKLKQFLKPQFVDFVISIPHVSIVQRVRNNLFLKQEKYFQSNSIGLAYVTLKNCYQTIMTQGDHGFVNRNHSMILLCGRGGIQTINGNNVMNALDLGYAPAFTGDALRSFLVENKYPDFDFTCLRICKRRQILLLCIKTFRFLSKKFKKTNAWV
jgi:hypothetical protein